MSVAQHELQEAMVGFYNRGLHLPHGKRIIDLGVSKTLKSGIWSPYLINLRHVMSQDTRSAVTVKDQRRHTELFLGGFVSVLNEQRKKKHFDHLLGPAQAGTPLMAGVAALGGFSLIWERVPEDTKNYGSHSPIEGNFYDDQTVIVGDDVLTEAKAKLQAIGNIHAADLQCDRVVSGVDRQQGGEALLAANGVGFQAVVGISVVAEMLQDGGCISQGERDYLLEYTNSTPVNQEPADWYWKNVA